MILLLEKKSTTRTAIVINSVTFGLFYGTSAIFLLLANINPVSVLFQMIYATFIGLSFGYMYTKTRSLFPNMIYHYLLDVVGQLFLYVILYNIVSAVIFTIMFVGILPNILVYVFLTSITGYNSPKRTFTQEILLEREITE